MQYRTSAAQGVRLDEAGNVVLTTRGGELRLKTPVLYQTAAAGQRQAVSGRYQSGHNGRVGFQVDDYDHSRELVLDPVLDYSGYVGGSGNEDGNGIAIDSAGNAYIVGSTWSRTCP